MNNKIDDVLELTREISLQDSEEDIDFSVTDKSMSSSPSCSEISLVKSRTSSILLFIFSPKLSCFFIDFMT